jgi:hypothetical protein
MENQPQKHRIISPSPPTSTPLQQNSFALSPAVPNGIAGPVAKSKEILDRYHKFDDQFQDEPFQVRIVNEENSKTIDPSHRRCKNDRGKTHLFTLEEGEKLYVICKDNFSIKCMSYLTENTKPVDSTTEDINKYVHAPIQNAIVIEYKKLDEYKFNAACIISTTKDSNTSDMVYVGILLKSYGDPVFENKLYLDYIENVHATQDITSAAGMFTLLTNVVIRNVDSEGNRIGETLSPEMLFVDITSGDNHTEYKFHAYVRDNNGISVELGRKKSTIKVLYNSKPDNLFVYKNIINNHKQLFTTDYDDLRVPIDILFPEKTNTLLNIIVTSHDVSITEYISVRVSKVSGKFFDAVKNRSHDEKNDDSREFDIEGYTLPELTSIFQKIKTKKSTEMDKYLVELGEDMIHFLTV